MKLDNFKTQNSQKAIFLTLFFAFLLLGFQVFAADECNLSVWNNSDCTVDIYYEDPSGGSDLAECKFGALNGTPPLPGCSTVENWDTACACGGTSTTCNDINITIGSGGRCSNQGEGACKICSKAVDIAGNEGHCDDIVDNCLSLNIDYTPPETAIECDGTTCSASWYNADIIIALFCSDGHSGCDKTYYCVDQAGLCDPNPTVDGIEYTGAFTLTAEGTNYVIYYSKDVAGNIEQPTKSQTIKLDKTLPTGTLEVIPSSPEVGQDITITISANDGESGIDYLLAEDDGTYLPSQDCGGAATCDKYWMVQEVVAGDHTYCGLIYDLATNVNNTTPYCITITVREADTAPPYRVSWNPLTRDCANANTDITVTVEYADDESGMAETKYCWTEVASCTPDISFANPNGGTATQSSTGNWTLCVKATDNALSPNSITECEGIYIVDKQAPNLPSFNPSSRDWLNTDVAVIVTYNDNLCGIDYTRHCWTEGVSCEPGTTEASTFINGGSVTKSDNGIWTLCTRARDGAGSWRDVDCSGPYQIDKDDLSGILTISPMTVQVAETFTVSVDSQDSLSGVDFIFLYREDSQIDSYSCGGLNSCSHSWDRTESTEGVYTYQALIYDIAGNSILSNPEDVTVTTPDTTPPTTTLDEYLPDPTNDNTPTYSGVSTDAQSNVVDIEYRVDGGSWLDVDSFTPALSVAFTFTTSPLADGTHTFEVRAQDEAGNWEQPPYSSDTLTIDAVPPTTTISPNGEDWGNSDVDFTFSCDDGTGSGCQTTEYKIINQSQTCDTAGLITGTSGAVTCPEGQTCQKKVCFRSIDNLNNEETINTSNLFKIDKESPLVGAISPTTCQVNVSTSFSADVSDNIEVTNCWLYICGGEYGEFPGTYGGEMDSSLPCPNCTVSKSHLFTTVGDYDLYAYCIDEASNPGAGTPVTVEVTEFGPLICDINVPGTGVINQWIEINVSGSQGAIVEVRFASNLIGEPAGSWTDWYNWDVSFGDWDASSKIMKWSFAEAGNYEVWTELKDGAGDTQACYATILIMECYPGQEDICTSDLWGCTHTIRCTSQGTWPSCPEDECIRFTENDPNCPCSGIDVCVGPDYYDYPEYGSTVIGFGNCNSSCTCNVGMALDQPCAPIIYPFDPHCTYCGDGHCDSGETVWNCCPDCGIPELGCDYNLRYWYTCDNHNPTKHTEDCGSDSWTENYQCSRDILQREYCERGCQDASCYENCYPVDWQDCNDLDGCVGPDYYDYSCSGAACVLSDIIEDYSECMGIVCGDDNCDGPLETVWTCCQDCEPLPPPGCDFNTRYYYTCPTPPGTIPQKNTEDCGSDSWTENYQCSADNRYVQREYCERGCQDASCYENCYWLDWQDCDSWDGCIDADYHDYSCSGAACIAEIFPEDPRCAHGDGGHDQCNTDADCEDGNPCTVNKCDRPEAPDSICYIDEILEGESCGTCKVCDSEANCINRPEIPEPYDDCHPDSEEGCQRCISGSCQDYSLACGDGTDKTSCECISDVCIDCSDYYDGGCGYQGICHCGPLEKPFWSCSNWQCSCVCQDDPTCEWEEPDGYPEVIISPPTQEGDPEEELPYEVTVINHSQNGETYTLIPSVPLDWSYEIATTTGPISSGQSVVVDFWVTSPEGTPSGEYDISVTAQNENFGTGYAIYEIPNQPPYTPSPQEVTWDYCSVQALSLPTFYWNYSDPEGDPQTAYEIRIDNDSNFSVIDEDEFKCDGEICSGGGAYSFTPLSTEWRNWMNWDTNYWWIVGVKDSNDNWSEEWSTSGQFRTPLHSAPWPDFTPSPDRVSLNQVVTFEDNSVCYTSTSPSNGGFPCQSLDTSYEWDFDYIEPAFTVHDTTKGNAATAYGDLGNYKVKLRITDDIDTCYSDTKNLTVTLPLPEWREIPPF